MAHPLVEWAIDLRNNEGFVADDAVPGQIERVLERILWRLMHSFVHGYQDNRRLAPSLDSALDLVQYVNFPMYSQYKAVQTREWYWIKRFPMFFGKGSPDGPNSVASRYLLLYYALIHKVPDFSLTGFAGNQSFGLRKTPRFVAIDIDTDSVAGADPPRFSQDGSHLYIRVTFPAIEALGASASGLARSLQKFVPVGSQPTWVPRFESVDDGLARFWEAFNADFRQLSADVLETPVPAFVDRWAPELVPGLVVGLKGRLNDDASSVVEHTAVGLGRFLAWNFVLGFRRLLFCPFGVDPPPIEGERPKSVSSGGAIVVFRSDIRLERAVQASETHGDDNDLTADAIRRFRFFVDVAGPRALLPDWTELRRLQLRERENYATAVSYRRASVSILHEEGTFCTATESLLRILERNPGAWPQDLKPAVVTVKHLVRDRQQLLVEFSDSKEPLKSVAKSVLYPSLQEAGKPLDIDIQRVNELTALSYSAESSPRLQVRVDIGDGLRALGVIPNFDERVLFRILLNLVRNSTAAARKNGGSGILTLSIDVTNLRVKPILTVTATDDCGGELPSGCPGEITYESWTEFLVSTEDRDDAPTSRGVGFYTFAKYAAASGGYVLVANKVTPKGVKISLGLPLLVEGITL